MSNYPVHLSYEVEAELFEYEPIRKHHKPKGKPDEVTNRMATSTRRSTRTINRRTATKQSN